MEPSIHQIERRERRGRRFPSIAIVGVIGLIAATWAGLFMFLSANSAFGTVQDVTDKYICDPGDFELEFPDLSRLSELYTSDGVLLGKLTLRNSQPVALEEIPDVVKWAVISAEDGDFYEHEGVDFKAIARAAIENARTGNIQGGSTITQQIVKKVFLGDEQTIERKICEAVVAAELERRYTKDQILEFYMNSQFFGENAYGVKAAAQEYWGKDLRNVTIAEAAAMVIPIRNPSLYDIRDNPEGVLERRNSVIQQMYLNGFITKTQADAAKRERLEPIEHREFEELAPQVIIAAREEILRDNTNKFGLGETYTERNRALFGCPAEDTECEGGGGLKVTVTVNYELQVKANEILRAWFRDPEGPTGALAMVDNKTGAVKVMASGLDFGDDLEAGQRPYDLATKGRRQAGSAFKPFGLAAALEYGSQAGWPITLGTYWDYTSPQKIECPYVCSSEGNIWTVRNAGSGGEGIRTLEQATYLSTNTVYAQVSMAVGPENVAEMANRVGIESPLNPVPSIVLGVNSVSPLEMASAYSTFANFGMRVEDYLIERIEDANGNIIYEHQVEQERVLDEALTASMVGAMRKVVSQGTATRANIGRPQAGKTGTAQNFRDVWYMGFIPQYTTAVWVGYPDAQVEMVNFTVWNDLEQREDFHRRAFGGTVAAPIWKQFMLYVTEDLPVEDFPPDPAGTEVYRQVPLTEVPDVAGMTQKEAKDAIYKAGLFAVFENVNSLQPEGTILEQIPGPGTSITQGKNVTVRISTGLPPEAPMPNLVSLPISNVQAVIDAFIAQTNVKIGWQRVDFPTPDASQWGKVVTTNPAPGEIVGDGDTVQIFVGVEPPPGEAND